MEFHASDPSGKMSEIFWGEIAPCEHLLQIYAEDEAFLDALSGFVGGGLAAGEGVIVLATSEHIRALEDRLRAGGSGAGGIDLVAAGGQGRYIALEAQRVLPEFMVEGWPDEDRFEAFVISLLMRAGQGGRRVRAFGELVALLWRQGHTGATVRLEHLWHRMCHERGFSLFCAYPRIGFTQDADASIREICDAHSKVLVA